MSGHTGIIFDIKRFAIHDGPGIRTTVFFKGCPLSCVWCHNPEGISPGLDLWLKRGRCAGCGTCARACSRKAISMVEGRPVTDRGRCVLKGECASICPARAREIVGRHMSVAEVMGEVERDRVFYEESGGGVTFCGGEPLMQASFLGALLQAARESGLHTTVDTTCHAPWEVLAEIVDSVDLFLCDIKHMDPAAHEKLTGVGNGLILDNIRRLAAAGRRPVVRIPVIPGLNDSRPNMEASARYISSIYGVARVDLLPYNEGGRSKLERLERAAGAPELTTPSPGRMRELAEILAGCGVPVGIGG